MKHMPGSEPSERYPATNWNEVGPDLLEALKQAIENFEDTKELIVLKNAPENILRSINGKIRDACAAVDAAEEGGEG